MNTMSLLKTKLFGRLGKTGLLLVAVLALVLVALPQAKEGASAATCPNPPTQPQLNVYPITFTDPAEVCHDFAPLDARLTSGQYSQSQADLDNGLTANEGDEIYVLSYIHNGAANVGVPDSQTLAHDVAITFNVPTTTGTDHVVSTRFGGSNTNTVTGNYTIHTPSGSKLEIVPNSGELYDDTGTIVLDSGFNPADASYIIDKHNGDPAGDLRACFEFSVFVRFKVRVVQVMTPPTLTNNAVCISNVVITPNPATSGQSFTGTVSLRNTGTTAWTNPGYTLAAQNTLFSPSNVALTQSISPDSQVDFHLSGTLPNAPGTYTGGWQMSASGVLFGAVCPVTVVINPIPPSNTTLSIVKEVRDVTTNGSFAHSITANQNDTAEYRIKIRNTGSVTANNVIATDTFPSGLTYIDGSLAVSTNFTGQLTGNGMALGNLTPNQEVTITYSATVNNSSRTIVNTATARADNAPQVQDTANVTVNQIVNNPVVCTPDSQSVDIGQTASFRATGGNGSFSWTASNGHPSSGSGSRFTTSYNDSGTFTVTVTSDGDSDTCTVRVNAVNNNRELDITKLVRNLTTGTSFRNSVNASDNDRVEYQVTVKNTGNTSISNVRVTDDLPNGLTMVNSFNGDLGTLSAGREKVLTFQARVNTSGISSGSCLVNTAFARGDNVSRVEDSASVCVSTVLGETVNLQFSKKAFNDTRNADAQSVTANRDDFITYTLMVSNSGNAKATNFVIIDDLSGVLPFADMVDLGGGSLSGNVITYPSVTVPANGSVQKTFRIRIKHSLQSNLTFVLRNTYGNTVTINVGSVLGVATFVAPKTGAAGTSAAVFAGLLTSGFLAFRKRRALKQLIFT